MAGKPIIVRPLPFTIAIVGNERSSNPALHLGEFKFPAMTWRTNGASNAYFVIDLGSAQTIDFVALMGANAQSGTTINVSMDNSATAAVGSGGSPAYNGPTINFITPALTGQPFYHAFYEFAAPQTYRYLAVFISGHSGDFEASTLVVGRKVPVSKYYETEWEAGPLDLSTVTDTRNGIPDDAAGVMWRQLSFTLGWLTEAEWETSIYPLLTSIGKRNPVYICFDPEATTYRQGRTYFGRMAESRMRKRGWNRFERSFEIRSYF